MDPISSDLIIFIMGANSVFIRSIYQLDYYTLLVDLNVPPSELDLDLATDIIGAAQKYFWTYQEDTYTLSIGKANDLLTDPRIIHDYSFYLVEGYIPQGSSLLPYLLLFNFQYMAPMEVYSLVLYNFWGTTNYVSGKLFLYCMYLLGQLE